MLRRRVIAFLLVSSMVIGGMSPYLGSTVYADEIIEEISEEIAEEIVEEVDGQNDEVINVDDEEIIEDDINDFQKDAGKTLAEAGVNKVIARFDFENLTDDDAEITGEGALATGSYTVDKGWYRTGKGIRLNEDGDSDQYLKITDLDGNSLVKGLDEITVSYDLNLGSSTSDGEFSFYLQKDTSNYIGSKHFKNGWNDVDTPGKWIVHDQLPSNQWIHLDYVIGKDGRYSYYRNGALGTQAPSEASIVNTEKTLNKLFGDSDTDLYIGKALVAGAENFSGYIDNFTVYNYALSAEEVSANYKDLFDDRTKDEDKGIIAKFDFNNLTAANAEITGDGAKATGTYSITDDITGKGKALDLNGKQFINVKKPDGSSILTGLVSMTISYEAKVRDPGGSNWTIYAAADTTAPTYTNEKYIGLLQKNDLSAERYYCSGRRDSRANISTAISNDDWVHVDYVLGPGYTALYANGVLKGDENFDKTYAYLPMIFGENGVFQVGKANWGSGEYLSGCIDNVTVYNYALSADEVKAEFNAYKASLSGDADTVNSLDQGYVYEDFKLLEKIDGKDVTNWDVTGTGITVDGNVAKVSRGGDNSEVTLTATTADGDFDYKVIVLKEGASIASYTITNPIQGQAGGMILAKEEGDKFEAIHSNQPVMYTTYDKKSYSMPTLFRKADGNSFGMVAINGVSNKIILYDSDDLISYKNERYITLDGVSGIGLIDLVYDLTDERYELYVEDGSNMQYLYTSTDLKSFKNEGAYAHKFRELENLPSDAVLANVIGLTQDEYDCVVNKFTNPYATELDGVLQKEITVDKGKNIQRKLNELDESVEITYSNGEKHTYKINYDLSDIENIESGLKGDYTLHASIGGDSYIIDADKPLIPERADPFVTYDAETGYYYFTASYPMYGGSDKDGYDRLVLRRAKTVNGLATAEEYVIWDENSSGSLGRFIWAPEIHKINGKWYFIATAGLNSGTGTSFNIRPFMIRFNGVNTADDNADFINPEKWGEPVLVNKKSGDNILGGMSLDMTYFENNGHHYLVWPDETKNTTNPDGKSYIYIAETDGDNPTQLISEAKLLTKPEYSWECVNIAVNEGPAVIKDAKNHKIFLAYSASATGSEYCVGYMEVDDREDLLDVSKWTKNPYPILTSGDFDNKLSGPGHNSFTVNANGEPIIVFHARPAAAHSTGRGSHAGDSLYDPCRNAYIRPVFYDTQGIPILNLSDTDFAGEDGSAYEILVHVENDSITKEPILEYTFDEKMAGNKVKNTADSEENIDGIIHGNGIYMQDKEYGQVLYLNGDESYGGNGSYLEFPRGFFDKKRNLTISMDVNEVTKIGDYFTFTIGANSQKYVFTKLSPNKIKAAITTNSSQGEKIAEREDKSIDNTRDWINLKLVIADNSLALYRNGELYAKNESTGLKMSDLGTNLLAYIGKSFYSADVEFRGYFDNIRVYEYAMSEEDVRSAYAKEEADRITALSNVNRVADTFSIPNSDDIRGNITLPSDINGVKVVWTSSNETVISTKEVVNDGYDNTPAGVVTRQATDTAVRLKAIFSKDGQESVEKSYDVKVIAKPKEIKREDYKGYLFARFKGEGKNEEQTYFSTSEDGFNWTDLNDNNPVLFSNLGENGVRDHYIARSPEGDKFYMIATDLSIYHTDWGSAQNSGSHSIVVWESTDLVNWSEPWLAEVAPWVDGKNPGDTWAPEFIYDEKTGEYVVYFATRHPDKDYAIYYCKTRDFRTFTDTKLYHESSASIIDSTMIKEGDTYYRYTKSEVESVIVIDKSDSLFGEFTEIPSKTLTTDLTNAQGGVEGPMIFKLNEKDENGKDQWCLLVDRFATSRGYYPLVTNDLSTGEFRMLKDSEYSFPSRFRHGYVLPITADEYKRLNKVWGYGADETIDPILDMPLLSDGKNVVNGKTTDITGNAKFDNGLIMADGSDNKTGYIDLSQDVDLLNAIKANKTLTISATVRNDTKNTNDSERDGRYTVFSFGKDENNFFAFSTANWERARATFTIDNKEVAEDGTSIKYNTAGMENVPSGEWYPTAIVLKDESTEDAAKTRIEYYVNYKKLCEVVTPASISQLGDLKYFYIGTGESNWKNMYGGIKNFRVYDKEIYPGQMLLADHSRAFDELDNFLHADKDGNVILKDSISLPLIMKPDINIHWESSNKSVLTDAGVVSNDILDDASVELKVTLTSTLDREFSKEKVYKVKIMPPFEEWLDKAYNELEINNINDVRGNLTLPLSTLDGKVKVSWKSDAPEIISDTADEDIAAGVVNRPSVNTTVTLTATLSAQNGKITKTKTFAAKVKKANSLDKFTKYMFAYFIGDGKGQEKIFFADSKNGLTWKALNEAKPVLESTLGEKGLRDPFIIRSPEGDRFYLIATDLCIGDGITGSYGSVWTRSQVAGSKSIMVWESTDLVNWSEQRMCKIAVDDAGCTWAPEACWDDEKGAYMVFWASKTSDRGNHRIFRCYTRDFYTYTDAEVWIELLDKDSNPTSIIDTTIIDVKNDDGSKTYYRFSKNEGGTNLVGDIRSKCIFIEKADSLNGIWTRVDSSTLSAEQGVEGPTIFKFNNEDKWCLLLDNFGAGGYYPMITTDLSDASFTKLTKSEYSMPVEALMRHGTVLNITEHEYAEIEKKWGNANNVRKLGKIADFSFDNKESGLIGAGAKANVNGTAVLSDDVREGVTGKSYNLDKSDWLSVTNEDGSPLLAGSEELTVSYWTKITEDGGGWNFFAAPDDSKAVYPKEKYFGVLEHTNDITIQKFYNNGDRGATLDQSDFGSGGVWRLVTITATDNDITLYLDGKKIKSIDRNNSLTSIFGSNGIVQIGKGNWNDGEYNTNTLIDDYQIYNIALTDDEVSELYKGNEPKDRDILVSYIEIKAVDESVKPQIDKPYSLKAIVYPDLATNKAVVWKSSDEEIATVDSEGNVTFIKGGYVTITATATDGSECYGIIELYVEPVKEEPEDPEKPDEIQWLDKEYKEHDNQYVLNLAVKEKCLLEEIKKTKEDGRNYKIKYEKVGKKLDSQYATFAPTGLVTAKKAGVAHITLIKSGEEIKITVNVYNPQFKYEVPKKKFFVTNVGEESTPDYEHFRLKPVFSIDGRSERNGVAKIDPETGKITALKKGTVTVTATVGGEQNKKYARKVTTKVKIFDPTFADFKIGKKGEINQLPIGKTLTLKIKNGYGNTTWSVADDSIATIDNRNRLKAVGFGKTTVTAINNGRVIEKEIVVPLPEITSAKDTVAVKRTLALKLKNGIARPKTVWSVSDEKIATITQGGVLKGVAPGKVTVIAENSGVKVEKVITVE